MQLAAMAGELPWQNVLELTNKRAYLEQKVCEFLTCSEKMVRGKVRGFPVTLDFESGYCALAAGPCTVVPSVKRNAGARAAV